MQPLCFIQHVFPQTWDDIKKIADVIIKKGPYLKLYCVYIRDFSAMNFHFDECCNRYPKFSKLVKVNSFPFNFSFTSDLCTFPGV